MFQYIGTFSSSFAMSIAMWPFVSLLLTLPVLALIYHRYHRLRFSSALAAYLVILYLLALVFFTLWPMPDNRALFCATHHYPAQLHPLQFLTDLATGGREAFFQIVFNIIFFVPLGFIMGRVFRWRFYLAIPASFLTSLMIETAQLTGAFGLVGCAYRHFDVDDLIWNTSGAIIGLIFAGLVNWIFPPRKADAAEVVFNPSFMHRSVAMAVDLVLSYAISSSLGFGLVVFVNKMATHRSNGDYGIGKFSTHPESLHVFVMGMQVGCLLLFELLIPLARRGQTLGGAFTHMSFETKPRHGWMRALFYLLRTALVLAIFGPWSGSFRSIVDLVAFFLLIFYLFKREMPYDLIPADPELGPPADYYGMPGNYEGPSEGDGYGLEETSYLPYEQSLNAASLPSAMPPAFSPRSKRSWR
ncbi:teicoplanin resistance protein VanZ [Bombiscardovia apis]|uniref:Teicoplanin resistance protein VanZ n=1 Tax=Bombiscardovia apis TaxID=2932182 RepID=A0ABN6SF70_9BIFI|nr:VanZ family protein [Bombiscardovia apis]BDR53898.1 teicoplanin resistance protein VanZ [Bombiscardovia apis]